MSTPALSHSGSLPARLPNLPPSQPAHNAGLRTLTQADNDVDAVSGWLLRHQGSPHTFDSYKREAERLLAWCADRSQTLSQLMSEDMVAYQHFLQDPQPREKWCLQTEARYLSTGVINPAWRSLRRPARHLADGSPNPAWRPFVSGLSPAAAKQALTILFGLFEYLCAVGYLAGNPLRAARTRSTRPRQQVVQRYLGQDAWQFVLEHLESWPRRTAREMAQYHRTKFLLSFLYLTGLRRSEIAQASTADLLQRRGQWWLQTILVAVVAWMMNSAKIPFLGIKIPIEMFAVLAMIPIGLYSGKKASGSKVVQWAFYLFYPVHLTVLVCIRYLIEMKII